MRRLVFALLALSLGFSVACRPKPHGRAKVAVSVFPVYDLARRIAGEDADVILLLPPGKTPHGASLDPQAQKDAAHARLVVGVGLGLDDWIEPVIAEADPKARVLRVGDRVPTLTASGDAVDPHVWLDPQRARLIATAIVEELGRADAAHALAYRKRAEELDGALAALDKELEARTAALQARGFVSFHPAFAYYAERYRLEVLGVVEKVPNVAPTPAESAALVARVKERGVQAIFREPQLPAAAAEAIARDAHVTMSVLDPLGGASEETDSYEELLRFDTAALESLREK